MVLSDATHGVENRRRETFLTEDAGTAVSKRDHSEAPGSVDRDFTQGTRSTALDMTASRDHGAGSPQIDRRRVTIPQKTRGRGGRDEEETHAVTGSLMPAPTEASQRNVADAALVAKGAIKSGYLWKMGSNVPKWKRRFFVLKPITMLFYYMSEYDTEPRGCIDLDLFDAIRKVEESSKNSSSSFGNSRASSSNISSSSSSGRSSTSSADSTSSGNKTSRISDSTIFELYRSGCQGGSGFMLEARGNEDWEQWVEAIANGRHDKMRAELEVVRGANKLLLEEISGLEQQVATFRGYADQRHVTVLALRDERQRCREVASEVSDLANVASTISALISQYREREKRDSSSRTKEGASPSQAEACINTKSGCAVISTASYPDAVATTAAGTVSLDTTSKACVTAGTGAASSLPAAAGADEEERSREGELAEERRALETIRSALMEARAELERRGRALEEERAARRAVEGLVEDAEKAVLDARETASKAEASAGKARGRVSVLERNVEFLRGQQRGLRAELCQAREKVRTIRAQRALLKKEIRDKWSTKVAGGTSTSSGARTWASMGDLAGSQTEGTGIRRSTRRLGCDGAVVAQGVDDGAGEKASSIPRVMSAMSSLSGDTVVYAGGSNGGTSTTTDLADISSSEASEEGGEIETVTSNQFQASVRRSIFKRVGNPRVPPLPPSRHLRTLQATRSVQSRDRMGKETEISLGSIPSAVSSGSISSSAVAGSTKGATGAAGLGMAGLLLGLKKGVVDKAAQEMGKKLSLWPGGMPNVSSFGSLSNAASNAASAQAVFEESSGAASDWTPSADVSVICPGSLEDSVESVALEGVTDDVRMLAAGGIANRSPSPALTADGGLSRVSSMSSRTALIQLSDLELAESCGASRSAGGADATAGLRTTLPPRPEDEYELLFTSRVIGLQFKELAGSGGVVVQGRNGYVGPRPTGVPGERLHPEIGDVLESYNGVSARGKSAEVVAGEIAQCGRPLRLGFRSYRVDVIRSEVSDPKNYKRSDSAWEATGGSLKGGSGGSCREDVSFSAPAHTWAVSS